MAEEAKRLCEYPACGEVVNSPHDEKLCVFHAPVDRKGEAPHTAFKERMSDKLNRKDYNFRGYVFHIPMDFRGRTFSGDVSFDNAEFHGILDKKLPTGYIQKTCVDFENAKFLGKASFQGTRFAAETPASSEGPRVSADFRKAEFQGAEANFAWAKFIGGKADFSRAEFTGTDTIFSGSKFPKGASFSGAVFSGDRAGFDMTQFGGDEATFLRATFKCEATDFTDAKFTEGTANFAQAHFAGAAIFIRTQFLGRMVDFRLVSFGGDTRFVNVGIAGALSLVDTTLGDNCVFYFQNPDFYIDKQEENRILFSRVRFKPFASFFENIVVSSSMQGLDLLGLPVLAFRYCQLKDVHFSGNDMSLFSFFKSSLDQARFVSCTWDQLWDTVLGLRFLRKNVILEERMFTRLQSKIGDEDRRTEFRMTYELEDLDDYAEVASLYRKMKTALDGTKDYQEAGWFYFNEFEMKRLALQEQIKKRRWVRRLFSRLSLYNLYKALAGYGEKPLWSFFWFWILTAVFAGLHLLSGLHAPVGKYINYDISFSLQGAKNHILPGFLCELLKDYGHSLLFTLYRIIPVSYLPYQRSEFYPLGFDGMVVSFLNTAVLLLMVVFIGIGLKRHFRRF